MICQDVWPQARMDRLREVCAKSAGGGDYRSYGQIAKFLNEADPGLPEVSRHSVAGKCKTMGITNGENEETRRERARVAATRRNSQRLLNIQVPPSGERDADRQRVGMTADRRADGAISPEARGIQLLDLDRTHCRWPHGTPGTPDFHFCGADRLVGDSYCPYHKRIAYQQFSNRRPVWPTAQPQAPD